MKNLRRSFVLLLCGAAAALAGPKYDNLVDLKTVVPDIIIDLRYAQPDNVTGHALYPRDTPALVRPTTAARLARAQAYLRARHFGLKIWDAYRPLAAQIALWQQTHQGAFVADPFDGDGSLHTWGVAVDATLVDGQGHEVAMPTGFDEFKLEAMLHYGGENAAVKSHLAILQAAMLEGGFFGLHNEWWHFVDYDWKKYAPIREAKRISD